MQEYDDTTERQAFLTSMCLDLERVNKDIAQLLKEREELTSNIIDALGHNHEGQKSYDYDVWKIEVKTPCVYTLDKKRYQEVYTLLPNQYNPVKESVSYSVDKKQFENALQEAPNAVRDILCEIVDKKPSKATVTLKERTA